LGALGGIALATLAAAGPLGVGGLLLAGASGMLWGGSRVHGHQGGQPESAGVAWRSEPDRGRTAL